MREVKIVRLVVFCEEYWTKGLIYTQNILPLIKLAELGNYKIEIYSFTSILSYFQNRKRIKKFREEMKTYNVDIVDMFTLYYPTRYLITRWELLPFYKLNVAKYIKHLNKTDVGENIYYNIRSYEAAIGFYFYYENKENLVFDTRTDWVEENINAGTFSIGSKSEKFWTKITGRIISSFRKTLVISDIFKQNLINRYGSDVENKINIVYNPIDYSKFDIPKHANLCPTFLYTGSFGKWNNLITYLDFFKQIHTQIQNSKLIICTCTAKSRVLSILNNGLYDDICSSIEIHYNVHNDDLPLIYSKCDYGLQLMTQKDSRVGVKFIEYIAAGVMPIVNANVQGAAFLAKKYGIGEVIEDLSNLNNIKSSIAERKQIDKRSPNYLSLRDKTDLARVGVILSNIF